MTASLRLRLLIGSSVATTVVFLLLGTAIFASIGRMLRSEFDAALLSRANAIASAAEQNGRRIKFEFDEQIPEFLPGKHSEYFQISRDDGSEVARSPSLGHGDLIPAEGPTDVTYANATLPDGRSGRALTLRFAPRVENDDEDEHLPGQDPRRAVLTVARETRALDSTLSRVRWLLVGLFAAAIGVSGVTLLLVVVSAMRPVERLARDIESFRETELSNRLQPRGVPRELLPIVERLNGLLARLEAAFVRERAFTADVAHELRTPLAGLRTTLQVCRSRPRDGAAYEAMIDKCTKMCTGIQSMVETLLLLARAEAGQLPVTLAPIDLRGLIEECWALFQPRADRRALQVEFNLPENCPIESDSGKLRIVINNLLDNAVSHSDQGGVLRIDVEREEDFTTLQVSNSGSQVTEADAAHLFERFWRGDVARSNTGLHCGLGLSLCHRLVGLIGGRIVAQSSDGVFSVRVSCRTSLHRDFILAI